MTVNEIMSSLVELLIKRLETCYTGSFERGFVLNFQTSSYKIFILKVGID